MENPKKILLVDDEIETINFLRNIFEKNKYQVFTATQGSEALKLAKKHKPNIIVLDLVMPGLSGGEVANKLSQDPATADIPIIFLSGLNTKEDEKILQKETGICHILAKPISAQELLTAIDNTLRIC